MRRFLLRCNTKKNLKDKWISELRSNKCKQIYGRLHDGGNGYCVLGILAKVSETGSFIVDEDGYVGFKPYTQKYPHMYESTIPMELGLAGAQESWLIEYNDLQKWKFSELADWIDINVPEEE